MTYPTDIVQYLVKSGSDKNISEEVSPVARPRDGVFTLSLTNDAANALLQQVEMAVLYLQWRAHKDDPDNQYVAPIHHQEAFFEVVHMSTIAPGWVVYHTNKDDLPSLNDGFDVTLITGADAVDAGYPGATDDGHYHLLIHIASLDLGEIQGNIDDGTLKDINGRAIGTTDESDVVDIGTGSGSSGTDTPDGRGYPTGSGDGNTENPDGGDKIVKVHNPCADPIINFPFCSDSFSFDHANLRDAITNAAIDTGKLDPTAEQLVSAQLSYGGAAYGGVTVNVSAEDTEHDYSGSGGSMSGVLETTDAQGDTVVWSHSVEKFGVSDVLEVFGYHYRGRVNLKMLPAEEPITLTGEMSQLPTLSSCHTPPDENDPAWLEVCLESFVKHRAIPPCWKLSPHSNPIDSEADCEEDCLPDSDPGGSFHDFEVYGPTWRASTDTLFQVYTPDFTAEGVDFSVAIGGESFDPEDGVDVAFRVQSTHPSWAGYHEDFTAHLDGDYTSTNWSNMPVTGSHAFSRTIPANSALQFYLRDTRFRDLQELTNLELTHT